MAEFKREVKEKNVLVVKRYLGDARVTIAGGQGEIKTGQIMALGEADGKMYIYDSSGTGGKEIAVGVFTEDAITSTDDFIGSITQSAIVDINLLEGADLTVDLIAKYDLQRAGTYSVETVEGVEVNE